MDSAVFSAMGLALNEARKYVGATSPNPPVGAVVLDSEGSVLAFGAHRRSGTAHAEARALEICIEKGTIQKAHSLIVTLEPCNHSGKTPPCVDAILRHGIARVYYGSTDPNPIAGGGAERLRKNGVQVTSAVRERECDELLLPFRTRILSGIPFITVKTAHQLDGSMIPPVGRKTFTSEESLRFAHQLRKESDAVLTGSGTVLADNPQFTVRHVPDHPGKSRWLVVLDRRGRVPPGWTESVSRLGLRVVFPASIQEGLRFLSEQGVLQVLVEAGPELSGEMLAQGLWHRQVQIFQGLENEADRIVILRNDNGPSFR
ncbi:MAG: bifunctional diaminohydroxyphosphoribosylaminopyrimidine deaminase/5-amino-6-(5-phosphoribosylamino)uracil reductase RibD [Cryobacterium sp.]|nr:bifunctional diaminohydroxyphosphoribosylaminopyrimidine deaminase/5-amino-6-(5-phosphoribosylamino)uracil reductase RibD [Oligoflexia bacterium]